MRNRHAATFAVVAFLLPAFLLASPPSRPNPETPLVRPKSGKVEIMPASEIRPGMKAYAWTVFAGTEPEPIPVEIIGVWKKAWGPGQDIILGKMGGKAIRTNVAGGMSGSPVYINGRLIGAVALRLSVFSPDAICGITPIESMLEVKDFDGTVPADARVPQKTKAYRQVSERMASDAERVLADNGLPTDNGLPLLDTGVSLPGDLLAQVVAAGAPASFADQNPSMIPIETPLTFSGFDTSVLKEFSPLFQQLGLTAVMGGASGTLDSPNPAPGWRTSLRPGDPIAGVLVSGDMSITGLGTVTYNDGSRVLAFGHPFFNLGPVDMPMSKGEILFTNASAFQPNKFGNATEIVGALHQDRHSAIMGVLGDTAPMVPVRLTVRSFNEDNTIRTEKNLHFNVFVQQKWTPYLMMMTLYNSISELNDYREDCTYRVSGKVELAGDQRITLATMQAPAAELPIPAPVMLAGWWGDKFNRLFMNAVKTPQLKSVIATIDLLPDRRIAAIENAWIPASELEPGEEVPVKVFLHPYRGPRIERTFTLKIPEGLPRGEHRILLSDAQTLDRMQRSAGSMNRFIDIPQIVSLINQEHGNNKLYVSLVEARPTVYYDDKVMPSLPSSVLNVMQTGRSASRPFAASGESAIEQTSIPFDYVIDGSYSLTFTVK